MAENRTEERKNALKLFGNPKIGTWNPYKIWRIRRTIKKSCYTDIINELAKYGERVLSIAEANSDMINPAWLYFWAIRVGNKNRVKKMLLESKRRDVVEYAYRWAVNIGDRSEMKQVILNCDEMGYPCNWAIAIGDYEEMKDVVFRSGDKEWIGWWNSTTELLYKG